MTVSLLKAPQQPFTGFDTRPATPAHFRVGDVIVGHQGQSLSPITWVRRHGSEVTFIVNGGTPQAQTVRAKTWSGGYHLLNTYSR
jgi:hypothetical protein